METTPTVSKSSITDLKSHSSSSIAAIPNEAVPSTSPQPTKTRSFDDRECLRTAATASDSNASSKGIDCTKAGDASQEKRKSSENISLHCENNEPNTNVRHENISAKLSNASDTNLDGNSLLSDAKVRSESFSLSTSPPKITVMCAPCIDDMLAAQHAEIECDVSDNEEMAQIKQSAEPAQCSKDVGSRKQSTPTHETSNLQLTLEVKKTDEIPAQQEDLSPSMDEYEECNPTSGDYLYDTITGGERLVPGCIAPAPTPAPLIAIAPLAEIEVDPPDDEMTVTGIEKPPEIKTDSQQSTDAESTAKPQLQQQQSQTSRTKKKKQKSTDKGKSR